MEETHENEHETFRIRNLESFEVLDSSPELFFDQLTLLASAVCQTPVAFITFVNSSRQWFKSCVGIEMHEIPRYISPCNQTIKSNVLFEIKEADVRENPYRDFMLREGFHYYAGVPIVSDEGYNIGTLCVLDYKPRELDENQKRTLRVISRQITDILNIRRRYKENLERLHDLSALELSTDKHAQEIAHKASLKAMAELATGLSYRIKPHIMNIKTMINEIGHDMQGMDILTRSTNEISQMFESLDRFISAEKEKSMKVVDLKQSVEAILKHYEYKTKELNVDIKFHCDQDVMCIGNVAQIKEAVYILLSNAVEAVEHMRVRKVDVILKEQNHKAIISVQDSGRGISETIRPFIFQPFFTTKGTNSLGVGLSLAQNLMQMHSGEVVLERPFGPTTFSLIFPKP
jgi:signal transduction histidine kinase